MNRILLSLDDFYEIWRYLWNRWLNAHSRFLASSSYYHNLFNNYFLPTMCKKPYWGTYHCVLTKVSRCYSNTKSDCLTINRDFIIGKQSRQKAVYDWFNFLMWWRAGLFKYCWHKISVHCCTLEGFGLRCLQFNPVTDHIPSQLS